MTTTTQERATEALSWFETARRDEDDPESSFVRTKDGAPEWVTALVYAAHGEFLPDDFRYQAIRSALQWIADEGEDDAYEFAYSEADVYTSALIDWLGSNLRRIGYVDEAAEELGPVAGIVEAITRGQAAELAEVYQSVRDSLES